MTPLPVIDIAALLAMEDRAALDRVARAIDAAAGDYGLFHATGHGIAPALLEQLEAVSHRFFAISEAAKARIGMPHGGKRVDLLPALVGETGLVDAPRWDGLGVHDAEGSYGDYLVRKAGKVFPGLAA